MFKKIEREANLSELVSRQIQALILEHQLKPNDRLPAERDLAERFGVSRTVVREAVRGLVAKGLLEVTPGRGGTIVRLPTAETMSEMMTLFLRGDERTLDYENLIEVRRVLEVAIAGFAAERRTAEDLQEMEHILEETLKVGNDRDRYVKWDLAFHQALARATHNRLFPLLLESVNELMIEVRQLAFRTLGAPARSYRYHLAIFDQVKAGDADGAREAMRDHLVEAEQTLRKALAMQDQGEERATSSGPIRRKRAKAAPH
ncbi:MAG: FadR family transcriptional regulator [Anaerolineae bacterium]|nr:FadR family transcriptional regulator [Anaerolineae bacterium]